MAFFNVDDQFHGHPKARRASLAGVGLWTVAGSHCRAYKSDGFVPRWFVDGWKALRSAALLVESDLWHQPGDACDCLKDFAWPTEPGWRFHDWHDINETSDELEARREKDRERQRQRRKRLQAMRDGEDVS